MAVTTLQFVGAFLLPLLAVASSFDPFHRDAQRMDPMGGGRQQGPFIPHEYVRFADVKRQCRSVLSAAADLKFDANRAAALMPELSFVKGDWKQDVDDGAPGRPGSCGSGGRTGASRRSSGARRRGSEMAVAVGELVGGDDCVRSCG